MKRVILNFILNNLLLIAVIFFGLFTRVILLNQYPAGITHDELNYIIAAKSLFWTGSFAPGTAPAVFPTQMTQYTVSIAEVPSLLLAIFIAPFKSSLFASRILGAILSTCAVLAVYLLAKRFTGKKLYALICALLLSINPWSVLMGRTIFEVNFFTAFFLWGFLVLLGNQGWKIFYAFPLYVLGFFSYTGGQISFYFFILITLIYHFLSTTRPKRSPKPYLIFFSLTTLMLIGYMAIVLGNQSFASRGSEVYLPSNPEVARIVNQERLTSVQTSLNRLFINKGIVYAHNFLDKYLNAFSVNNLFINGEFRAAFSYQKHGTFYAVDLIFIMLGIAFLFKTNRRVWLLIIAIVAVSPLTSGLSLVEYSYSQRAGLMFPFLVILSGLGVCSITALIRSNKIKGLLLTGIGTVYLLSYISLMHLYFYRFPVYASDGWFFQDRTLSRYIEFTSKLDPNTKIVVTTTEPKIVFQEYLFFTDTYRGKNVSEINSEMEKQDYSYKNVSFVNTCLNENPEKDVVWISDGLSNCRIMPKTKDTLRITRFRDIYEHYLIKNDLICHDQPLGSYVSPTVFRNMELEKQNANQFCQSWITRL